jgi:hypothetical protein
VRGVGGRAAVPERVDTAAAVEAGDQPARDVVDVRQQLLDAGQQRRVL